MRDYFYDDLAEGIQTINYNPYKDYKYICKFKNNKGTRDRIVANDTAYFNWYAKVFKTEITGIDKINRRNQHGCKSFY